MNDLGTGIGTIILFMIVGIVTALFIAILFAVAGKKFCASSKKDWYDWFQLGIQMSSSVVIASAIAVFSFSYQLKEHQLTKLQQEKQYQLAKLETIESLIPDIANPDSRLLALKALEVLGYVKEAHTLGNLYFHDDPKVKKEFFTLEPQTAVIKTEVGVIELHEKKKSTATHPNDSKN